MDMSAHRVSQTTSTACVGARRELTRRTCVQRATSVPQGLMLDIPSQVVEFGAEIAFPSRGPGPLSQTAIRKLVVQSVCPTKWPQVPWLTAAYGFGAQRRHAHRNAVPSHHLVAPKDGRTSLTGYQPVIRTRLVRGRREVEVRN